MYGWNNFLRNGTVRKALIFPPLTLNLGIKLIVSEDDVERGYRDAMFNMARLNRTAGSLMNMYGAHGATEVAGNFNRFFHIHIRYIFV